MRAPPPPLRVPGDRTAVVLQAVSPAPRCRTGPCRRPPHPHRPHGPSSPVLPWPRSNMPRGPVPLTWQRSNMTAPPHLLPRSGSKEVKPVEGFSRNQRDLSGLQHNCKVEISTTAPPLALPNTRHV